MSSYRRAVIVALSATLVEGSVTESINAIASVTIAAITDGRGERSTSPASVWVRSPSTTA